MIVRTVSTILEEIEFFFAKITGKQEKKNIVVEKSSFTNIGRNTKVLQVTTCDYKC